MLYPLGLQDFEEIRKRGFVYIDKTDVIYQLCQTGKYYFLGRPRRFGKTLLLSTLDKYLSGRKELFDGLKIASLEKDWTIHPILHISLNSDEYIAEGTLEDVLNNALVAWEKTYGSEASETSLSLRFKGVIERARKISGQQVAVLIDEYDKPLIDCLTNEPLKEHNKMVLKAFYGTLKNQDANLCLALLTGVTKFSKVSVFSELNNLTDISMAEEYQTLCGVSEDEIDRYFSEAVAQLAQSEQMSSAEARETLRRTYDGYRFCRNGINLYNPYSLMRALSEKNIDYYWFETGTPTFLAERLKATNMRLEDMEGRKMDSQSLRNMDAIDKDPIPMIYQSGYLTITGYDNKTRLYTLGYPNEEVKSGFFNFLLPYYANVSATRVASDIVELVSDANNGHPEQLLRRLSSFFAGYNYDLIPRHDLERHYQNVIYTVCKLMGMQVEAEYHTSNGRIDLTILTDKYIYLFEFKLNVGTPKGLQQIARKDYAAPFANDPRQLFCIAVNFSSATRGIDDWQPHYNE
jgi:hypothetical protein